LDGPLIWLITGIALIIIELVTSTFYLLVLGIACLAGAVVGYGGGAFIWQALVAAALAVAGVFWVQQYKKKTVSKPMQSLDFGQPAAFESWVSKDAGQARVKYRDTLWDAEVTGEIAGKHGEILYIDAVVGSSLKVSKTRPA
jgi:membrane protein implicated in regulation of membrane protease activity